MVPLRRRIVDWSIGVVAIPLGVFDQLVLGSFLLFKFINVLMMDVHDLSGVFIFVKHVPGRGSVGVFKHKHKPPKQHASNKHEPHTTPEILLLFNSQFLLILLLAVTVGSLVLVLRNF